MEMAQVGVRTRSRAALAMGAPASSAARTPKRRKINDGNQDLKFSSASSFVQHKSRTRSSAAVVIKPETVPLLPQPDIEESSHSPISDELSASCCSSNGSIGLDEERIKALELEVQNAQAETSTCNCSDERREMILSSELGTNSQDPESMEEKATEANSRRIISTPQLNMPTESELEEFFAAAEKDIQKRFSDKYNYDIVKDVPLEGRYEWVQLKP